MQLLSHISHLAKLAQAFSPEGYTDVSHTFLASWCGSGHSEFWVKLHPWLYTALTSVFQAQALVWCGHLHVAQPLLDILGLPSMSPATALQMASLGSQLAFSNKLQKQKILSQYPKAACYCTESSPCKAASSRASCSHRRQVDHEPRLFVTHSSITHL